MALRFKMLPWEFESRLFAHELLELQAFFQLEYEDRQSDKLAQEASAGSKTRMTR